MATFALPGNKEKQIYTQHSSTPLEMTGTFYARGPTPVSAIPDWIVKAFEDHPELDSIAFNVKVKSPVEQHVGVVYQRMEGQ